MSSSNFFLAIVVGALKPSITFVSLPSLPLAPSHSCLAPPTPSHSCLAPLTPVSLPLAPVLLPSLPLTPSHSRLAPLTPSHSCLTPLTPVLLPSLPLAPNGQNRLVGSQPFLWGQGARWELEGARGVRGSKTEGPHHLCGAKGMRWEQGEQDRGPHHLCGGKG